MFEVKIAEAFGSSGDSSMAKKTIVRVGFSTAGSSLFLDDQDAGLAFENEGAFMLGKNRKKVCKGFSRNQVVTVLLNLEAGSPNANTASLFIDGARASKPQAIPEQLQ